MEMSEPCILFLEIGYSHCIETTGNKIDITPQLSVTEIELEGVVSMFGIEVDPV